MTIENQLMHMKKIKILTISLLAFAFAGVTMAQSVDEKQMNQDIEVMESILAQMFFGNNANRSRTKRISGNYLPGFGLILKIPRKQNYYVASRTSPEVTSALADVNWQMTGVNVFTKEKTDSLYKVGNSRFKATVKSFFMDYGDLISQLKAADNIMVIFGSDSYNQPTRVIGSFVGKGSNSECIQEISTAYKITAQINYNEILDYRRGSMSEAQFAKKIRFSERSANEPVGQEFIILSGIFDKLYDDHAGLFSDKPVSFERVDGLGVLYEMSLKDRMLTRRVTSATQSSRAAKRDRDEKEAQGTLYVTPENYKEKMNELKEQQRKAYEELKEKLKHDLIRYGKTLKSLQTDEILMLSVKMSNCLGCEKPEKLNLVVKAPILKDYHQQRITLSEAMEKIEEKEVKGNSRW